MKLILGILDRLNPAVDIVVSGHTHQSYICDYATKNPAKPFLLTSATNTARLLPILRWSWMVKLAISLKRC